MNGSLLYTNLATDLLAATLKPGFMRASKSDILLVKCRIKNSQMNGNNVLFGSFSFSVAARKMKGTITMKKQD